MPDQMGDGRLGDSHRPAGELDMIVCEMVPGNGVVASFLYFRAHYSTDGVSLVLQEGPPPVAAARPDEASATAAAVERDPSSRIKVPLANFSGTEPPGGSTRAMGPLNPSVGDTGRDLKRGPVAEIREVRGFYLIDFANSVYATVGIGGFLPLLIQAAALANAGFPDDCLNVLRDEAELHLVRAMWSTVANLTNTTTFYRLAGAGPLACDATGSPSCFNGTCTGYPKSLLECRDITGSIELALLTHGAVTTDPTAYATLCITVSVVCQAIIFFFLGPLADFGDSRKKVLLGSSWLGATLCFVALAINKDSFTVGMLVAVVTNVCFGVSGVLMNAFLPLITAALPEVREKAAEVVRLNREGKHVEAEQVAIEREALETRRSTEISARGFASGYAAGVIGIILCIPLVALIKSEILAYQLCQVIAGVWWASWMMPVAFRLLPRPGPPLPTGQTVLTEACSSLGTTLRELLVLPRSFAYLIFWMFFSDGVFLVGSIGGLYANSRVDWGCFPKAYGVLVVFILVPLFAMAFNLIYEKLSQCLKIPPERMLQWCLVVIGIVVPVWGFNGITTGLEVIIVAVIWAAHMGPLQAFSRSVFASLIPPGKEVSSCSRTMQPPTHVAPHCPTCACPRACLRISVISVDASWLNTRPGPGIPRRTFPGFAGRFLRAVRAHQPRLIVARPTHPHSIDRRYRPIHLGFRVHPRRLHWQRNWSLLHRYEDGAQSRRAARYY